MLPTPVHRWGGVPGFSSSDSARLWVKRDDLSGFELGGNKVRKLEFLLAEALEVGADTVVTIGGVQSNHCRATACAARALGLDAALVLRVADRDADRDVGMVGNLLLSRAAGASLHVVTKREYALHGGDALGAALAAELEARGKRPYVIPVGGSNALGTWGYLEMVAELERQVAACAHLPVRGFDRVVLATGSGGTAAGVALGVALSGMTGPTGRRTKVVAYAVCDDESYFYDHVQMLLDQLGAVDPTTGEGYRSRDVLEVRLAKGLGYAISDPRELAEVAGVSSVTGVLLDPVYTGKAFHGMLADADEMAGEEVLYLHTGGAFGMFDKAGELLPHLAGGTCERLRVGDTCGTNEQSG